MKPQLVFVYNASSDLFSSLTDFAHKIISPSTYNCHLCTLLYNNFTVKKEWKNFIKQLPVKVVFLHKNELEKLYQTQTYLPAVFIKDKDGLKQIISKEEINRCEKIDELKALVTQNLLLTGYTDEQR